MGKTRDRQKNSTGWRENRIVKVNLFTTKFWAQTYTVIMLWLLLESWSFGLRPDVTQLTGKELMWLAHFTWSISFPEGSPKAFEVMVQLHYNTFYRR